MLPPTFGDLATFLTARHQNVQAKQAIARHSAELTTGRAEDLSRHLGGDFGHLSAIEREMTQASGLHTTIAEARARASAKQLALGQMAEGVQAVADILLSAGSAPNPQTRASISQTAEIAFRDMVNGLNTRVGGVSLFAGSATDEPAMAGSDTLLSNLRAEVSGLTTLSDVDAALDAWFDTPGGDFETLAYQGSTDPGPGYQLGSGTTVSDDLRADDAEIRATLKALAKAALAADAALGFAPGLATAMITTAQADVLTSSDRLTGLRAGLGGLEESIETAETGLSARVAALEVARGELIGVDSFEAASRLEQAQFRLESLYTVTARLSRLSLLEYLR